MYLSMCKKGLLSHAELKRCKREFLEQPKQTENNVRSPRGVSPIRFPSPPTTIPILSSDPVVPVPTSIAMSSNTPPEKTTTEVATLTTDGATAFVGITTPTPTSSTPTIEANERTTSTAPWSYVVNFTGFLQKGAWYGSEAFEKLIQENLGESLLIETSMTTTTKVCFVSSMVNVSPLVPYLFRNYNFPPNAKPRNMGECEIPTWKAVRASAAAPGYFEHVEKDGKIFRDGAMIANNPSGLALNEALNLWNRRPIELLLSIGTGRTPSTPLLNPCTYSSLFTQLVNSCTDPDKTHSVLEDLMAPGTYYRLQPESPAFSVGIDETSPEALEALLAQTLLWIEANSQQMLQICNTLTGETSS